MQLHHLLRCDTKLSQLPRKQTVICLAVCNCPNSPSQLGWCLTYELSLVSCHLADDIGQLLKGDKAKSSHGRCCYIYDAVADVHTFGRPTGATIFGEFGITCADAIFNNHG